MREGENINVNFGLDYDNMFAFEFSVPNCLLLLNVCI